MVFDLDPGAESPGAGAADYQNFCLIIFGDVLQGSADFNNGIVIHNINRRAVNGQSGNACLGLQSDILEIHIASSGKCPL